MASLSVDVRVKDLRWFKEIAVRLGDLLDALGDLDLPDHIERKADALRGAISASSEDDLPEP